MLNDDKRGFCDAIVINLITAELRRARSLHAKPNLAALVEEVGEVAKDIQEGKNAAYELIQVATVAIRLVSEVYGKERLGYIYEETQKF